MELQAGHADLAEDLGAAIRSTAEALARAAIAPEVRVRYRDRLRAGGGFTAEHPADLAEVPRHEAAARRATVWSCAAEVQWVVIATDGKQRPAEHLGYGWDGRGFPCSERHDDKMLVTARFSEHSMLRRTFGRDLERGPDRFTPATGARS